MGKTIDIFGHEFVERVDGLYECPGGCKIDLEDWGMSNYFNMVMLFLDTAGGMLATILCPEATGDLLSTYMRIRYENPTAHSVATLTCNPDNMLGVIPMEE